MISDYEVKIIISTGESNTTVKVKAGYSYSASTDTNEGPYINVENITANLQDKDRGGNVYMTCTFSQTPTNPVPTPIPTATPAPAQ